MDEKRKNRIMVAASILVSLAAGAWFVAEVGDDWSEVGRSFTRSGTRHAYLIPSVGAICLFYAFRVVRWRAFLRPLGDVSHRAVASATLIGFMANCVLPLRVGELIRPYVLHRKGDVAFGEAFGTAVGLERVFDLIGVCCMLLAAWLAMSGGESPQLHMVWRYGLTFVRLAAIGAFGLLVFAFMPRAILKAAAFCLRVLPASWRSLPMRFLEAVARSLRFVKHPGQVVLGLLYSLGQYAAITVSTWFVALALGIRLSPGEVLLIQLAVTVAVAAPQAPAFIGLFHFGILLGTRVLGIPDKQGAALAILTWVVNVIPITAVGLVVLQRTGLRLGRLARASRDAAAAAKEPTAAPGDT